MFLVVNMEYQEFAKYYDLFYQKKDYQKEVLFLKNFLNHKDNIIDLGCGTGIHAGLLAKDGYQIDGLDLNKEMLEIAKNRIKGKIYNANILAFSLPKKYDVIISMFAVFNHLKNLNELTQALTNCLHILKDGGKIILDFHNPKKSGQKEDTYDNLTRIMIWHYSKLTKREKTNIMFKINDKTYQDIHTFRIFTINEINKCCHKVGLKVTNVFENYDINKIGNKNSKNLQFIIEKL